MPEEFRAWKERVDAAVAKKAAAMSNSIAAGGTAVDTHDRLSRDGSGSVHTSLGPVEHGIEAPRRTKQKPAPEVEKVTLVFGSREEARLAFLALLSEKNVSSTMRAKDVQELCQEDPRWEALKGGDKKQELAEFQTRKLKEEREQQRLKTKKCKDAFLLMLAECVQIDARTRWSSAIELLQKDARFKNVEDARDREDLFNDFVKELEKKEREDRLLRKDNALQALTKLLDTMHDQGRLHRKSVWSEHKAEIINLIVKEPELRALEESDARRCFNDMVDKVESAFRQQRKLKKISIQEALSRQLSAFRDSLRDLVKQGVIEIDANTRWKELTSFPAVQNDASYKEVLALMDGDGDEDWSARALGLSGDPRDVFLDVQKEVADSFKVDKSLIREFIVDNRLDVTSTTAFADFKNSICDIASVKEVQTERSTSSFMAAEEGEEIEEPDSMRHAGSKSAPSQLRQLLVARPHTLEKIFASVRDEIILEEGEHVKRARRREDKYNSLLSELFYRSDHVRFCMSSIIIIIA